MFRYDCFTVFSPSGEIIAPHTYPIHDQLTAGDDCVCMIQGQQLNIYIVA